MTLNDGQAEVGGVVIGAGTVYPYDAVRGMDRPDVRSSDLALGNADGEHIGTDYLSARVIEFVGLKVLGDSPSDTWDNLDAIEAAWGDTSSLVTVRVKQYGRDQVMIDARNRGFQYDDRLVRDCVIFVTLAMLKAPDPTLTPDP